MEKRFELTAETIVFEGTTLHRIKAIKDFGDVNKGELGGFVEREENLSHEGNCWIYDNAKVFDRAIINDDAQIHKNAIIMHDASVSESAYISDNTIIDNEVYIYGCAKIYGNTHVSGDSRITDNTCIGGKSVIKGSVSIFDRATIRDSYITGTSRCTSYIRGNAYVCNNASIIGQFDIQFSHDYIVIGPVLNKEFITFYLNKPRTKIIANSDSFNGDIDDFIVYIKRQYDFLDRRDFKKLLKTISYVKEMITL